MPDLRCNFCLWGALNERCRILELPLDKIPEMVTCLAFTFLPDDYAG